MLSIYALMLLFLGVGLFVRRYNTWTRLLLAVIIAGTVLLLYVL